MPNYVPIISVTGINGDEMHTPSDDAIIVRPIRDGLARQKSFALAAAESVSDQAVAQKLRDLAGDIQRAIYLHLDAGAMRLIQREAEYEEAAWRDEEARMLGIHR